MKYDFLDIQSICAIIFIIFMTIFLIVKRKKLATEKIFYPVLYIIMYRTKVGIRFINSIAQKYRKAIIYLGYIGIVIGFVGMAVIIIFLIKNLVHLITVPAARSTVGLVLPFKVKGAFFVPFFYWIICIFIIAAVHEFSHGIVAKSYRLKIKSSGFAFLAVFLPIIPAAFVEPDEKKLLKRPRRQQLSVFAAGPFANLILAGIVLIITLLIFVPIVNSMIQEDGVLIVDLIEADKPYPAEIAGIKSGEVITAVDDMEIKTVQNFTAALKDKKPGDKVIVITNVSRYSVVLSANPEDKEEPYLGVYVAAKTEINPGFEKSYTKYSAPVMLWIFGLLYWLFILNIGIGLFNLVPIGPVDGGRMMQSFLELVCKENKKRAVKLWKWISFVFLALVLANLAFAFLS